MEPTDAELVQQANAGDTDAYRLLVERYQDRVYGLAWSILRQREDAEDASQEAFVRAFRALKRYDPQRPFLAWMLTITANCCRTLYRKRQQRPGGLEEPNDLEDRSPCRQSDLAEEISRALDKLRPEYRAVFTMFHREQLPYTDIAHALGKPLGTIKTLLYRARQELMQELTGRGVFPSSEVRHGLRSVC